MFFRGLAALLLAVTAFPATPQVWAADIYWQPFSGDWSIASNWGGVLPGVNDAAYVVNGGTASITQPGATCNSLLLGNLSGSGAVAMTGGGLTASYYESIGDTGNGSFVQSGGVNSVSSCFYVGNAAGSTGAYSLSGNGQLSNGYQEFIGYSGSGSFSQSGGTNSTYYLNLASNGASSFGSYCLSGNGQLSTSYQSLMPLRGAWNDENWP